MNLKTQGACISCITTEVENQKWIKKKERVSKYKVMDTLILQGSISDALMYFSTQTIPNR